MERSYKVILKTYLGKNVGSTSFLKGTSKNLKSARNLLPNALIFKGSVGQICFKIENSCPSDVINKFPSLKIEVEKSILFDYNLGSFTFNLLDVYDTIV